VLCFEFVSETVLIHTLEEVERSVGGGGGKLWDCPELPPEEHQG